MSSAQQTQVDDVQRWCEHASWVRALAAQLVTDAALADDLAQDAWIQAMRGPRPGAGTFRSWIARTLRNLAVSQHRARNRRHRHEGRAVPPIEADDPATVAARLELHGELVEAVKTLAEPYRTAIALRYFEGLSPTAISARTGKPLRTVHTHLRRALAQLRHRLHGRAPDWRALLTPLTVPLTAPAPVPVPVSTSTALLLMMNKTKVALVTVAGVCAIAFAVDAWQGSAATDTAPQLPLAAELSVANQQSTLAATPTDQRRELEAEPAGEPDIPIPPPSPWALTGKLLDLDARPVAGVAVSFRSFDSERRLHHANSGPDGAFELTLPDVQGGHLQVDDPSWTTVYRAVLWGEREVGELTIVVAPTAPVAGTVVDETGRTLAGALIQVFGTAPNRARFDRSLERALSGTWQVKTDATGHFNLARAPVLPSMRIHADLAGHRTAMLDLVERQGLRLVLPATHAILTGLVVDAKGKPTEASVWCGDAGANTDAQGRFSIDLSRTGVDPVRFKHRWLIATKTGSLPARLRCERQPASAPHSWPQPLVLRLGGRSQTITGRVLSATGEPIASPRVKIIDPEYLGDPSTDPGAEMSTVEFMSRVHARVTSDGAEFSESSDLSAADRRLGGFEVRGLQDRSYRLLIEQRDQLRWMISAPIAAGSRDIELRMPEDRMWPSLAGVVVDRRGQPVAGASIWLSREFTLVEQPARRQPLAQGPPLALPEGTIETARITTDAEGRFKHGPLSRAAEKLLIQAPGIAHATRFDLARLGELDDLRLLVPVKARARIAATAASRTADSAIFFDASGAEVAVTITHGDSAWGASSIPLVGGRSEVMTVPDSAVELAIFAKGKELSRTPVDLTLGKILVIQPHL